LVIPDSHAASLPRERQQPRQMLLSFLSSSRFSALTAASVPLSPPAPVVTPGAAFAPDDWAVPRLLVPGAEAGELATPPADPAEPPVACANDTAGIAARAKITITVLVERAVGNLAIEILLRRSTAAAMSGSGTNDVASA
jgi:hypothetical protein